MGGISKWVLATFASPAGVFALGAADSSLLFYLPFGIDAAVVVVAARTPNLAWAIPLIATCGSLTGTAFTFWLGAKAGDAGLERFVPDRQLERARRKAKTSGAVAIAALSAIPPPFPFTPFVLVAGALKVRRLAFFAILALTRLARFALAAFLAVRYGDAILRWLESPAVEYTVFAFLVIAVVLTAWSSYQLFRRSQRPAAA